MCIRDRDTVEMQFTMAEVRKAAERLPEAQRQVIALRFGIGIGSSGGKI